MQANLAVGIFVALALASACEGNVSDAGDSGTGGGAASGGGSTDGSGASTASGAATSGSGASNSGSGAAGSMTGGNGSGGEGGAGTPADSPPGCDEPTWVPEDFATVYEVGPGRTYETPSDVPWESIDSGTLVLIHRRETPYADKWVISVAATADEPVVVLGVPENGLLPEITGVDAVTRPELDYWSDTRGIIKIGGSSAPDLENAQHIIVECLDIWGARDTNSFVDDAGETQTYDANASAIFVENGAHIELKRNAFHDCGNGLFVANQSSDVRVGQNHIWDNGNPDSIYEHNSYTEAQGILFEFNYYGELCDGCPGNNLKDRSSGLIVQYNVIEGGNRALDLVDSDYESIRDAADYDDTFVYGNVLVERGEGNRQVIHYGGDGDEANYRTGTLYFHHNTVVSERSDLAVLVRLSSGEAILDAYNNVLFSVSGTMAILEDAGTAYLEGNWLPTGILDGSPSLEGTVSLGDNLLGDEPGFVDTAAGDFSLLPDAEAKGVAVPLLPEAEGHPAQWEPDREGMPTARSASTSAGAYE